MQKVLFITNLPAPYRVEFFNEFGKHCKLKVCYERSSASDRDAAWRGNKALNYEEVYTDSIPIGADISLGFGLIREIRKRDYDRLIITNYASPSVMFAIMYCQVKGIPFYLEHDGGFNKRDAFPKRLVKKYLLSNAFAHLTTCNEHIEYLVFIGILRNRIYKYPFTSIWAEDILLSLPSKDKVAFLRGKLGINEARVALSVGQFIPRKGFDALLEAARNLPQTFGIYIIGGEATHEYLFLKQKYHLDNVHFVGFRSKNELKEWYCAADAFILPTREDVWGLVINEAMACGLPVITTSKCNAGLEMVREGVNGFIVSVGDQQALTESIMQLLNNEDLLRGMAVESLRMVRNYTIEEMAWRHMEILFGTSEQ